MPRLLQTEEKQKDKAILQLIANFQIERDMRSSDDLCRALGCKSKATAYRRLRNPGTLTIEELRHIKKSFNIPADVMAAFITRAM